MIRSKRRLKGADPPFGDKPSAVAGGVASL